MDLDEAVREMGRRSRGPRWRRWAKRFALALLLLIAATLGGYAWWQHVVHERLTAAVAELDATDPGWRLSDLEAARSTIPEAENSARVTVAVNQLLSEKWPAEDIAAWFSNRPAGERLDADSLSRLVKELDGVRPAVEAARKLAALPSGRYRIAYAPNPAGTLVEDQQQARRVILLLDFDSLRLAHEGKADDALRSCQALLNTGRSIGDEPLLLSQLIRHGGVSRACRSAERVLALGQPGADSLAALQRLLREEDRFPSAEFLARAARAEHHELFTAMESGEVQPVGAAGSFPNSRRGGLLAGVARCWLETEHEHNLRIFTHLVAAARLPLHEQEAGESAAEAEIDALPSTAILTRLAIPSTRKVLASARRKHAEVRCAAVALACERFRRKHNTWPESLDRLVPDSLDAVPLDPFDGAPLRYRRLDDGVVVYSVGPDRRDDGGSVRERLPFESANDIGARLWDTARRRQPPAGEAKP